MAASGTWLSWLNAPIRDRKARLRGMVSDPEKLPGRSALIEFCHAAEANARDLISDAEVLLEKERWPRAFALAVLAQEEFGKCLMAMVLAMASPDVVSAHLHELRSGHIRKLRSALEHEALLGLPEGPPELLVSMDQIPEIARDGNDLKQWGFYVDISEDGSLRQPSEIGEREAKAVVARVHKVVHPPGGLHSVPFWP